MKFRRSMLVNGLALSLILSSLSTTHISATEKSNLKFSDIKGHWAESLINDFINKGYISGYEDGTFKPNNKITRAEFIKIVNITFGFTKQGNENFTDVKSGDWYYEDVLKAVKQGYIDGYGDGTFRPNAEITREEACKIIGSILEAIGDGKTKFKDEKQISDWAIKYVDGLVDKGIIHGYEDNTFRPKNNATRAESVKTLHAAKDEYKPGDEIPPVINPVPPIESDTEAPTINVESHAPSFSTTENIISISGIAGDNKGIYSIEYKTDAGASGVAKGTENWTIENLCLMPGKNIITIIATDTSNNKTEVKLEVEYKGHSIQIDGSQNNITLPEGTLEEINVNLEEGNDVTIDGNGGKVENLNIKATNENTNVTLKNVETKNITVEGATKNTNITLNAVKTEKIVINGTHIRTTNSTSTLKLDNCEVKAIENGTSAITLGENTNLKLIANSTTLIGAEGGNGIEVPSTSTLDLSGSDLVVEGNNLVETKDTIGGSGIGNAGEAVGKIYIHDVKNLTSNGYGKHACGIGGVMADEIVIENSTIDEVKGGIPQESFTTSYGKGDPEGGVAIGVMSGSKSDKVTLENVTVNKATGGSKAAAIGAGYWASVDLTINNSTLTNVQGGNSSAGIGGSRIAQNSTGDLWKINIDNSTIEAKGGQHGAGIGSGYDTYTTKGSIAAKCIINITGDSVIKAVGGQYAAGIGTGYHAGGLKYNIASTVNTEGTYSSEPVRKDGYTVAQAIGYGVLDPNRSGYGVVANDGLSTFAEKIEAVKKENEENAVIVLNKDSEYEINSEELAILTGSNTKKLTIKSEDSKNPVTLTFTGRGTDTIRAAGDGKLVFENITIVDESTPYSDHWNFNNLEMTGNLEFNNVTFKTGVLLGSNEVKANSTFTNCTFTKDINIKRYAAWVFNGNAKFEGCTFNSPRSIKAHHEYGKAVVGDVYVEGCTFTGGWKPAVVIGDVNDNSVITIINNNINEKALTDYSTYAKAGIFESDTIEGGFTLIEENNK